MQENYSQTSHLTINLTALAQNYRLLQQKAGYDCVVAGVVKANAYGLGLEPVARTLLKEKCPQFFVATLGEALEFREIDKNTPVAVLGGLFYGVETLYLEKNIQPVINSLNDLARWQDLAIKNKIKAPTILHFDTGMNRLGLSEDDAQTLISQPELYKSLDVQWIMSHFACADEPQHPLTADQAKRFQEISAHFPNAKKSLGNSSGLFRDVQFKSNMVRPGIALYGGNPTPEQSNPMKQVVSLNARVLQTRTCKKGDSIGYGASHVFEQDTQTATVGIGYADGFLRSNSNKGAFHYQSQLCPILGRVSMDLVTIDISQCKNMPKQGDWVEVISSNNTIDDIAQNSNTISYEVLTSLGDRSLREYKQ